jgi:LmbE family N-acetylglucosaminyl deacetylase
MIQVKLLDGIEKPKILCLGAHSDDIEIGCGGTILRLAQANPQSQFLWVVLSGDETRREEALKSAHIFLDGIESKQIDIHNFRESYFPFIGAELKDVFEETRAKYNPDVIFTHYAHDAHQDHRLLSDLTWNTFRDHFVLEYEIPKYDGDLGNPNTFICLDEKIVQSKIKYICDVYQSQSRKRWFTDDTFRSILRIRGVESNSPSKYAEAFYCRKMVI